MPHHHHVEYSVQCHFWSPTCKLGQINPGIRKKVYPTHWPETFFFSSYILHLYQHYGCIKEAEEDALTIAEDDVVYKLGPDAEATEPEM